MLNMQGETDGSLLYYMSCRDCDADRVISDAAAIEFHRRHARGLFGRCRRICRTLAAGDDFAQDLASWTLARAVEKAATFVDAADGSDQSKRTLAWLQQIARNMLVDSQRNPFRAGPITGAQDQVPIEDYSDEEFAALLCDGKTLPRDIKTIGFVQRALATLDDRTRAVLTQTILQRQRSPGRSYMYRGSAEALPGRIILPFYELMDHSRHFAPVTTGVISKVNDQRGRLLLVHFGERVAKELCELLIAPVTDTVQLYVVGTVFREPEGDERSTECEMCGPRLVHGTIGAGGQALVGGCPILQVAQRRPIDLT